MAKSIAKNSVYNVLYKFLNVSFTVIAAAYVSRILLPEGMGKVSSAQNIVQYFVLAAGLGLPSYGIKAIAVAGQDRDRMSKVFSELFLIHAIAAVLCTMLYCGLILGVPFFRDRRVLFLVTGLKIPLDLVNTEWFYQGREEYRYILIRSLAIKFVMLIFVLLTVRTGSDYTIYALILVLATEANQIFNFIHCRRYVDLRFQGLEPLRHLRPLLALLAVTLSIEIYTLADITMLTFMKGDTAVGYYTNAEKAVGVIKMLVEATCAVFLPRLSVYHAEGDRENFNRLAGDGFQALCYFGVPATAGIILISNDLIRLLFGASFVSAALTTRILALSIATFVFSSFIGNQIMIAVGKERKILISTLCGAGLNIVMNAFLIPKYSFNGAAVASVITQLIVVGIQYLYVRNDVRIHFSHRYLLSLLLGTTVMVLLVTSVNHLVEPMLPRLILNCGIGVLSYCVITIAMKNEVACRLLNTVKRKVRKNQKD